MNDRHLIDNETLLREVCRLLSEGKRVKLGAKGDSMRPFIKSGDTLVIDPAEELRQGDIVLARAEGGRYVVHRIVGRTEDGYILMGDGNLYGRENCRREETWGRAVGVIRDGEGKSLITRDARMKAYLWHILLPLRRVKNNLRRVIKK